MKGQGLEQALFFNLVFYFSDSVTLLVGLGLGLGSNGLGLVKKQLDLDSDFEAVDLDSAVAGLVTSLVKTIADGNYSSYDITRVYNDNLCLHLHTKASALGKKCLHMLTAANIKNTN